MDPKKKNIIMISVAVAAMGYAGYSLLFSGSSSKAQTQTGTFQKRAARGDAPGDVKKDSLKKKAARGSTKKTALLKKESKGPKKNTLKKRPGRRGNRKTKKQEIAPAA